MSEQPDRRSSFRMDVIFSVMVESVFGTRRYVARDISATGMFIETDEPIPIGSDVIISFTMPTDEVGIVARGEVRRIYSFKYVNAQKARCSITGIGIRFIEFLSGGDYWQNKSVYRAALLDERPLH